MFKGLMNLDRKVRPGDGDSGGAVKSFFEHLNDLRRTILWSLVFLCTGMLLAVPLAPSVMRWLKLPLEKAGINADSFLRVFEISAGFDIALRLVFWTGLLLSLPLVVAAVASFVFPGLKASERRLILSALVTGVVLFGAGVATGYFTTLPVVFRVMLQVNAWLGIQCEWVELGSYISYVLQVLILFGLAFQVPTVLVVLGYLGLISSRWLREKRAIMLVTFLIVAMVLTPPDPFSQIIMAAPMQLLYELCIVVIWLKERRVSQAASHQS